MPVYGIDLGTTYSCVARIDENGVPVVIRNSLGEESTPSVVYFESQFRVVVGKEAKNAALLTPGSVVSKVKREMGRSGFELDFHNETFTAEAISALILRELVKTVEQTTSEKVSDVVITVPAYFGVAEREATRNAGAMAGLNVVNVVSEPVAAALYYGVLNAGVSKDVLVFDLGGGTFDTTVIRLDGQDVKVVCTDGDHELGGADWDDRLTGYLCEQFMLVHPGSGADEDESFLQELALTAEDVKKSLSGRRSRKCTIVYHGLRASVEVTREAFEGATGELLERAMTITRRTLRAAVERDVTRFDEVLLVGGSTRMPAIANALRAQFGFEPKMHEPDLAVAKGAALYGIVESLRLHSPGDAESQRQSLAMELAVPEDMIRNMAAKKVTIVVPRAFGVAVVHWEGDEEPPRDLDLPRSISHLLLANMELPVTRTEQLHTLYENQREIDIQIWEQAGPVASTNLEDNNQIGKAAITRLPPLPRGSKVDVTFRMDEGGMLYVSAQEKLTGQTVSTKIAIGDLTDAVISAARRTVERLS